MWDYSKTFLFFFEATGSLLLVLAGILLIVNLFRWIKGSFKIKGFKFFIFDGMPLLLVTSFSFLGFAIGLLIGYSQSPVLQATIPAVLTFYGGFLTYLFAKDSPSELKGKAGIILSIMAISFYLLYGVEVGTYERIDAVNIQRDADIKYLEKQEEIKKKFR